MRWLSRVAAIAVTFAMLEVTFIHDVPTSTAFACAFALLALVETSENRERRDDR